LAVEIDPLTAADRPAVLALWRDAEGVRVDELDRRERYFSFLERNPGLSMAARYEGELVGAVLCGHDGRIGYLHHMAVAAEHRRHGIGRRLVERCVRELRRIGIVQVYAFVADRNRIGHGFWHALGWSRRGVDVMQSTDFKPENPD